MAQHVRFPIDPRDVPASKAARRLHLTIDEFEAKLPALMNRGFPLPDPTTGMFDLKAIDAWMDKRSHLTAPSQARDAREGALSRIANL
ncbi:hypothetical protein KHC28_00755 [Ancylobacter sonchi]|uniref:hypothetical protein n=1 Tax=Ancylobacter sonchi TaxID=1937790 RepID=UPI001BD1F102|nr:hypothetical protein [Ancylobacter sonchi]MBS7532193.1 hypothetical protein [Ancylobacter sonchi]